LYFFLIANKIQKKNSLPWKTDIYVVLPLDGESDFVLVHITGSEILIKIKFVNCLWPGTDMPLALQILPLTLVFPYFPVFSLKINKNIPSGSSLRTEFALSVK